MSDKTADNTSGTRLSIRDSISTHQRTYTLTLDEELYALDTLNHIRELVCQELAHQIAEDIYPKVVAEIDEPELVQMIISKAVLALAEKVEKLEWRQH